MFDFVRLQFHMKNITDQQVKKYAEQGWITEDEAEQIISSNLAA